MVKRRALLVPAHIWDAPLIHTRSASSFLIIDTPYVTHPVL